MRPRSMFFALFASLFTGAAFSAPPVAYVYAPTPAGIYGYAASSRGELTQIESSPFSQTAGSIVGSNSRYFITVDSEYVHAYVVAADGAIGEQVSQIDTQLFGGSQCGAVNSAVLGHSGRYVYVLLQGGSGLTPCAVYQTYEIGRTGLLTFKGTTSDVSHGGFPAETPLTIEGNGQYAFEASEGTGYTSPDSGCNPYLNGFSRESDGVLDYFAPTADVIGPAPGSDGDELLPVPWLITNDPSDHFAIAVFDISGPGCGIGGPVQLASFTVNSTGDLTSTNTGGNMPTVPGGTSRILLNTAGTVLAVATGHGV